MKAGFTRFGCPLTGCGWFHDSPDMPPGRWQWKGSIEDTVAAVRLDQVAADERIIAAHFETHPLVEWAREVQRERWRADAAEVKLATLAEPSGHGQFWDDLDPRLKDPEFKRGYDETTAEIRAFDARMNGEDPS